MTLGQIALGGLCSFGRMALWPATIIALMFLKPAAPLTAAASICVQSGSRKPQDQPARPPVKRRVVPHQPKLHSRRACLGTGSLLRPSSAGDGERDNRLGPLASNTAHGHPGLLAENE